MWYFGKIKNTEEWGFDVFDKTFVSYIKITDEEHDNLVEQAQAQNKWISGDENGNPVLVDPPKPTEEEIKRRRIKELELFLKSTDWYAIRFADTGEPMPADIRTARESARDEISRLREELAE